MDLSGILTGAAFTCLVVAPVTSLAGCTIAESDTAALGLAHDPIPTLAATALLPVVPVTIPPTPAAAPTLPSPTPAIQPTVPPTSAPSPVPSPTPEPPTATPNPFAQINGVAFSAFAVMPPDVADHVGAIAARGRELGRNPRAFSKLGDSGVLLESNLVRFDNGPVNLGPYAFLQPAVEHFAGSWSRYGESARVSLTTIGTFDPMWADPQACAPGEHMLACEIRLHNPAVLLIRLGTNEGGAERYSAYLRDIVRFAIDNGVIPVLGTKADRFEGDDSINAATRALAAELRVPLWDFDVLAATLPNRGLSSDGAHLSIYRNNDYTDPQALAHGYPVSDLSALVMLDALRVILLAGG